MLKRAGQGTKRFQSESNSDLSRDKKQRKDTTGLFLGEEEDDGEETLPNFSKTHDRGHSQSAPTRLLIPERGVEEDFDASQDRIQSLLAGLETLLKKTRKELKSSGIVYADNGKEIYQLGVPISCPPEDDDDARKIENITTTFDWSGGEFGGKIGGIRRHKPRDWDY